MLRSHYHEVAQATRDEQEKKKATASSTATITDTITPNSSQDASVPRAQDPLVAQNSNEQETQQAEEEAKTLQDRISMYQKQLSSSNLHASAANEKKRLMDYVSSPENNKLKDRKSMYQQQLSSKRLFATKEKDDQELSMTMNVSDRKSLYQHQLSTSSLPPSSKDNDVQTVMSIVTQNVNDRKHMYQEQLSSSQHRISMDTFLDDNEKAKEMQTSIKEFERKSLVELEPNNLSLKRKSGDLECCQCAGRIFPADPLIHSFGEIFHQACFKCDSCNRRLTQHPQELQYRTHEQDYLVLLCQKCRQDMIHKHLDKFQASQAGQRILVNGDEMGNIQSVLESIGDELEEIILESIPKCATCGGHFLQYTGNIAIIGAAKYHRECFEMGRPVNVVVGDRKLSPNIAARYLPERIILKLSLENKQPLASFFFVWSTKATDILVVNDAGGGDGVQVMYQADEQAPTTPRRKPALLFPAMDPSSLSYELVSDPFGTPCHLEHIEITKRDDGMTMLSMRLSCWKYCQQHILSFEASMETGANASCFKEAKLVVRIISEKKSQEEESSRKQKRATK